MCLVQQLLVLVPQLRFVEPMRAFSVFLLCLTLTAEEARSQFLSRDFRSLWANEVFENYGGVGYRNYDLEEENRRFDLFGDLLIDGVDILEFSEVRRDAPGVRGSFESRRGRYDGFFNKLVMAEEGFGRWSTRLIIGDHVRTYFTPMTLNLPRFNGIRWDGSSRKSSFSMIAAHLTNPLEFRTGSLAPDDAVQNFRVFGTSLFGGHWQSRIGDFLRLGTTFVNTHRFDSEASDKINGLKGTVPGLVQGGLKTVFVFFADDAPDDSFAGAEIHQVVMRADGVLVEPLRVGRIDQLINKLTITPDLTSTIQIKPNEIDYLRRNQSWLQPVVEASNRPFFAAVLEDIAREVLPPTRGAPLRASGTDVVFYQFAVPDTVSDIEFEALLADDYSVDVVGAVQVPFLASGEGAFYYDWHHALRAEGHPSNRSNLRQVRFGYGFPTGLSIMGLDFDAQILGFEIKGEFARSTNHLKMPTDRGKRRERDSSVFYFNVLKSLHDRVDAGGEWFDMPDDYNTEFPIFQSSGAGPTVGGRLYRPFALVEDNDDLDDWPDELEHNDPFDPYFDSQGLGHGVFPGLDLDGDGILDFAAIGSDSPFLQYHVEAPDLSFGDDFNNNGTPDLRENDNLADYMYPLDHRGFHAFLRYNPTSRAQLRLGAYRMEQPTLGLDSDAEYIEGQYQRDWQDLGYVRANHRIKWVQDGIPNTVFNFGSQSSLQQDLLENRDAIDNLTYVEWGLWTVPRMNIRTIATFKHVDLSDRAAADPLLASPGTITHFAMANKIDYTYNWQRFKIVPRFKHTYRRSKFPDRQIPDSQTRRLIPILQVDYAITPNTVLKTGVQGFPLLPERSIDPANPERDFRKNTYTGFLQNRSNYSGYDLTILMGFFRTFTEFSGSLRPSTGYIEYFFKVYIG